MKVQLAFVLAVIFIGNLIQIKAPPPVLLDDIHYYVSDRNAAEEFFTGFFGARVMPHPGPKPLEFVTFLSLRPGEGTIGISPRGPFPGIHVDDRNRWKREIIEPSEELPPTYGVFWLGIRTPTLIETLTRLEIEGMKVTQRMLSLPHDFLARAVLVEGPDFNRIALVERRDQQVSKPHERVAWGDFGVDHLLLLVKSAKENEIFFREVYAGRVTGRRPNIVTMKVANTIIVLAEPEAFGLKRENVQPRDPKKFRYGIDHIGFLYPDLKTAVSAAMSKGYRFLPEGTRMNYYDEPTAYTYAITLSPDGLPCEMVQEDGRTGPRTNAGVR